MLLGLAACLVIALWQLRGAREATLDVPAPSAAVGADAEPLGVTSGELVEAPEEARSGEEPSASNLSESGTENSGAEHPSTPEDRSLLVDGARISGRVTEAATGRGVAGVVVLAAVGDRSEASTGTWNDTRYRATTDSDGYYVLFGLHVPTLQLSVFGGDTPYLDSPSDQRPTITLEQDEHREGVDLECARGGTISGRIVGPDGAPFPRAYVWAAPVVSRYEGPSRRKRPWHRASQRAVRSDGNGRYQTAGLELGYRYILNVTRPEVCAPHASEPILVSHDQPELVVNVVLGYGARIEGEVRWEDGSPAAGGTVTLRQAHAKLHDFDQNLALIDGYRYSPQVIAADGHFAFEGVGAGPHALCATHSDAAEPWPPPHSGSRVVEIEADRDLRDVAFVLHRKTTHESTRDVGDAREVVDVVEVGDAGVIAGAVVTSGGAAVEGATVTAFGVRQGQPSSAFGTTRTTGKDGTFDIVVRGAGPFEVHAERRGYGAAAVSGVFPNGEDLRLVFDAASISGRVVAPDVGDAERGFRVAARSIPPGRREWIGDHSGGLDAAECAEDGTFVLDVVPLGRVVVMVWADGFVIGRSESIETVPDASIEGITIQLSRGGAVTGSVTTPDGHPVQNAEVYVLRSEPDSKITLNGPSPAFVPTAATTPDGRFSLKRLEPGSYDVCAVHWKHGRSSRTRIAVEDDACVEIPPLALAPAAVLEVQLQGQPAREPMRGIAISLQSEEQRESARTGLDGSVKFLNLAAGSYVVSVKPPRGETTRRAPARNYVVELTAGKPQQLQISLGGGPRVFGKIIGVPAGGKADVFLEQLQPDGTEQATLASRRWIATERDYSFDDVAPGRYRLAATPYYSEAIEVSGHDLERNIEISP